MDHIDNNTEEDKVEMVREQCKETWEKQTTWRRSVKYWNNWADKP